jgi:nicotinamidase-related amidase
MAMPFDLTPILDPASTAVIALEVQNRLLLPDDAIIPGIARHAEQIGLIDRLAGLYAHARRVGVPVLYVVDNRRLDGRGGANNLMVGRAIVGRQTVVSHGEVVSELAPQPDDFVIEREHGMTGFYTTPLDAYLRNLGVTTVVLTGVSANIAVNGTSIEAMNLGYRVVVASDGIAGDPPEYVEQLLKYTIRNVAVVTEVQRIRGIWSRLDPP